MYKKIALVETTRLMYNDFVQRPAYILKVKSSLFRVCQKICGQYLNIQLESLLTSTSSKGLSGNFKKLSWDNSVLAEMLQIVSVSPGNFASTGNGHISWFMVPKCNHEIRGSRIVGTLFSIKPQNCVQNFSNIHYFKLIFTKFQFLKVTIQKVGLFWHVGLCSCFLQI